MIRDKVEGAIVNIGSTSALAGQPFIAAYCSSKGALATPNAQHSLRGDAQPWISQPTQYRLDGVGRRGSNPTRISRSQRELAGGSRRQQPFGPLAPAEVARAVNFLVSAESGMMTGSVINFDQSVWGAYPFALPTPASPLQAS